MTVEHDLGFVTSGGVENQLTQTYPQNIDQYEMEYIVCCICPSDFHSESRRSWEDTEVGAEKALFMLLSKYKHLLSSEKTT